MLKAIREFFDRKPAASEAGAHSIELATAALLVEVVRIDRDTNLADQPALHAGAEGARDRADVAGRLRRRRAFGARTASDAQDRRLLQVPDDACIAAKLRAKQRSA
jgi:hypothetical protein